MATALNTSVIVGTGGIAAWTWLTVAVVGMAPFIPTTPMTMTAGVLVGAVLLLSLATIVTVSLLPVLWAALSWLLFKLGDDPSVHDLHELAHHYVQPGTDHRVYDAIPIVRFLQSTRHAEVARDALQHLTETLSHRELLRETGAAAEAVAALEARANTIVRSLGTLAFEVCRRPSAPVEHLSEAAHDVAMHNEAAEEVRLCGLRGRVGSEMGGTTRQH